MGAELNEGGRVSKILFALMEDSGLSHVCVWHIVLEMILLGGM